MITANTITKLIVKRKSDLGYMLAGDDAEEVLLHYKESDAEYMVGDSVEVYIYLDKQKRKTATTNMPFITIDKPGYVSVVSKISNLGIFVNNNTPKDILISKDYLPYDYLAWPEVDDKLFCILKERKDYVTAKPLNKFDLEDYKTKKTVYNVGDKVNGRVMRITKAGIGIFSSDLEYIFVHNDLMRQKYRLGQEVEVTISFVKDDEFSGSLIENKEFMMDSDGQVIMDYLNSHAGYMPYDSKSSSEEIKREFNMSRKAFKRALGSLYKKQVVYIDDDGTYLVIKDE